MHRMFCGIPPPQIIWLEVARGRELFLLYRADRVVDLMKTFRERGVDFVNLIIQLQFSLFNPFDSVLRDVHTTRHVK